MDGVRIGARRRRLAGVVLLSAAVLAACSSPVPVEPVPVPTTTPTVIADKTAPPAPVVPLAWPLTGVVDAVAERPALAVKIENTAAARPQAGLESADVVWEEIVEFGVSRLVAVYHSRIPEEVGPIRSIRPADASIVSPQRGLLAFSGGQPGIVSLLERTPVQLVSHDAGDPGFYRVASRPAPHNLFGSPDAFLDQADADHSAPPSPEFAFSRRTGRSAAERLGSPATELGFVLAPEARPRWTWDAATTKWMRSEGAAPSVSASGERLTATNVVVIRVASFDSGFDAQNREPVPDLRLVGSGTGLVATGGRSLAVTWSKAASDAPFVLTGPDGQVATLAPGNTWVELVPLPEGSVTVG